MESDLAASSLVFVLDEIQLAASSHMMLPHDATIANKDIRVCQQHVTLASSAVAQTERRGLGYLEAEFLGTLASFVDQAYALP
eukprot:TRINITY_DN9397_c0_g1_i1.p2 TRINITY_DN9397_c0_g1~~TRINITY_DN9397_c0_g1_i1.p2  ORF type:complete len:83 (-),score=2.97 TRINITY_DN9397_c0_g1_i1:57-305(-)